MPPAAPLTTTSHAVLCLLALGPATAHELATTMQRTLRFYWPRAISKLYEEPRKLVAHGLATSRTEQRGRRPHTVYAITPAGREALRAWLAEPGADWEQEHEALLKVAFSDQGSPAGLRANVRAIRKNMEARLQFGREVAALGLDPEGPLAPRVATGVLTWRFLWDQARAMRRWALWAEAFVASLERLDPEERRRVAAAELRRQLALEAEDDSAQLDDPPGGAAGGGKRRDPARGGPRRR